MIIRSINKSSAINEALPAPLSKALKLNTNKTTFKNAAKKLRATLDDNTLSQVDKITNRDKRLKDKNYAIFIILDNEIAIFQDGKNIANTYSDINNMSWSKMLNQADYIYALYLPDARDTNKLDSRDNYKKFQKTNKSTDIKKRLGLKNIDKLFVPQGDGTYKVDYSVFDKIDNYLEHKSNELVNKLVKSEKATNVIRILSNTDNISDSKIRNEIFKLANNLEDLDRLRYDIKMFDDTADIIDDEDLSRVNNYIDTKVLYLLDLIR